MLNTASFRPTRFSTKETLLLCINCVLFARIGFIPRRVRSDISFFRSAIEEITGFINNANLARKYVSSLFDSNASRGRLIVTEPNVIDVVEVFSCVFIPFVEHDPLEKMIFPPTEMISDKIFEILETFPFSESIIIPIFGNGVECT